MAKSLSRAERSAIRRRAARKVASRRKLRIRNMRKVWPYGSQVYEVNLPISLNIQSKPQRRQTLKAITNLREALLIRGQPVILSFAKTERIYPTAGLLLTAELDRAKRILGDAFEVKIIPSQSERINGVLKQVGILDLCGVQIDSDEGLKHEWVRHWRYATGQRINEQTTRAFEQFEGRLADELKKGIWRGISEAIGNSTEHAYDQPRGTEPRRLGHKRWWMFSQERDGYLNVVVCDLGIGIPRSLPLKWKPSTLSKIFAGIVGQGEDVRAIRAALRLGASSTGKDHRGRGLPQIWQELQATKDASIVILSNRGGLIWRGRDRIELPKEFSDSIHGTVISWAVPIGSKDE